MLQGQFLNYDEVINDQMALQKKEREERVWSLTQYIDDSEEFNSKEIID